MLNKKISLNLQSHPMYVKHHEKYANIHPYTYTAKWTKLFLYNQQNKHTKKIIITPYSCENMIKKCFKILYQTTWTNEQNISLNLINFLKCTLKKLSKMLIIYFVMLLLLQPLTLKPCTPPKTTHTSNLCNYIRYTHFIHPLSHYSHFKTTTTVTHTHTYITITTTIPSKSHSDELNVIPEIWKSSIFRCVKYR